jgi:UDP-2,3-diacylglucosamine pyrophosphatase LpxH
MSPIPRAPSLRQHNVVVISDLHLGEDLSVDASEQTRRDVAMASAAAADFIAHLTQRRADGLPWRLVINGDLLDFLSIHVSPSDPRLASQKELGGFGPRDRLAHGAGRVPAASAIRVDMIAERHAPFFRALARFLQAGNRVDFIAGNHDREISHPLVAERVRAALRAQGAREQDLTERAQFHDWFVHEPGLAWIEHGHQYDEQCSFEHNLAPLDARGEVIANIDTVSVRYLGSVASVDPHSTEEWTFGGYLRYGISLGPRHLVRLLAGYARFVYGLWQTSKASRALLARRRRAGQHERRLADLAEERGIPVEKLRAIDELRRIPVTRSMGRVCRLLMIDRMLLSLATMFVAMVVALWGGWPVGFLGALATLVAGYVVGEATSRRIPRDPSMALATVPDRIRKASGLPVVVFGHTHQAVRMPLTDDGVYINGGTWLPAIRPGLLRAFTHVVVVRGKHGPEVQLRQWRDGRSRPFVPEPDALPILVPAHVAPAHAPAAAPEPVHVGGVRVAAAAAAAVAVATVAPVNATAATGERPSPATTTQTLRLK